MLDSEAVVNNTDFVSLEARQFENNPYGFYSYDGLPQYHQLPSHSLHTQQLPIYATPALEPAKSIPHRSFSFLLLVNILTHV